MFELKNISLSRGRKVLLDQASVRIGQRYRVGLVGRNGSGKSSLIQLLLGHLQEDGGDVLMPVTPDRVAYLEQSLPECQSSVIEYAKTGDRVWHQLQQRLQVAEQEEDGITIAECHARLQEIDGYRIEARAAKILLGLGFSDQQLTASVSSFSGGWQMRLQLARVLLARADLLLLDEPTNHLDIDAIIWLEQWLNQISTTVVVISHDRDFLDGVCSHILHLSAGALKLYQGHYSAFVVQYELQLEIESREQEKMATQRAHMQSFVDRFRAQATKAKQAQSRLKALEKLVESPGMQRENPFHFNFLACDDIKAAVINVDAAVGYEQQVVVSDIHLNIDYGDRLGLIGRNGQGKTTIMKALAGDLPLVSGQMFHHPKLNIAYFSQQQLDMLEPDSTPLQQLLQVDRKLSESAARRFLGGFDFSGDRVFDLVGTFSGGERARLALSLLIYRRPNLLLLDEPTNHMDMQMREAFILALQNYSGAVVLVSHDRYFMSGVVNQVATVSDGKLTMLKGDLLDYSRALMLPTALAAATSKAVQSSAEVILAKTVTIDRKRLRKLEARIEKYATLVKGLEQRLADPLLYDESQQGVLHELVIEHKEAAEKLSFLEQQWLDLNE